MSGIKGTFAQQGLVRPRRGRVLAGVCAGLGRRFGMSPWVTRVLFVVVLSVLPGSQLLIYPVLWVLMPSEEQATDVTGPRAGNPGGPVTGPPPPR